MRRDPQPKLLITGGCGFIGTNLVSYLARKGGFEVHVLDNESLGKREFLSDPVERFVRGDIRDAGAVSEAVSGMDVVVHLAADTRVIDSVASPMNNFDVNVLGTLRVLEAMRAASVRRLISASTGGAILGDVTPPVHEQMVPMPVSPYGASKLAVEGYCAAFAQSYGMHTTSLRFSNVYGPKSYHKGSVVAHFFKEILAGRDLVVYGDGTQTRDYVYVDDLCDGIFRALVSDHTGVYQLGTGIPTDLNRLVEAMREIVGSDRMPAVRFEGVRAGEVMASYCAIDKARRDLGYEPETDLMTGLRQTWKWFLENRVHFA